MTTFEDYVSTIEDKNQREKLQLIGDWMEDAFPQLKVKFGWGQPMFTDHGTFIIGFKKTKKYITVSPEVAGMKCFVSAIEKAEYVHTDNTFRIGWQQVIDWDLLAAIIDYNIEEKASYTGFWRKGPSEK